MDWLIEMIGYLLLWFATDVGRNEESKIEFLSKNWFIILLLLVLGIALIERF
jgi:hypothetical protein